MTLIFLRRIWWERPTLSEHFEHLLHLQRHTRHAILPTHHKSIDKVSRCLSSLRIVRRQGLARLLDEVLVHMIIAVGVTTSESIETPASIVAQAQSHLLHAPS
jgi:alkylhydroperoxidase/carboxymuconolactone decarboxylase family protein YurZ